MKLRRLLRCHRAVLLLACVCLAQAWPPALALAQNVQRIAAIVNDEVISGYDVEQRVNLVIRSGGLADTPETRSRLRGQVLSGLVDERLQLQEAKRYNITVTDEEIEAALRRIEKQNRIPAGRIDDFLQANGLTRAALVAQLRPEIAWGKLVQRRLRPTVQIGDDEIDEVLSRLERNKGRPQHRISEIFLPVDSPDQEDNVYRSALRLAEQLRSGASFEAVARQFSRGATASSGGEIGWVGPGQLAQEIDQALEGMSAGQISDPIRAAGGYYLIRLHERSRIAEADPLQTRLTMKQIVVKPGAEDGTTESARARAEEAVRLLQGCDSVASVAQSLEIASFGDLGTVKLADLPPNLRSPLSQLQIGEASGPIKAEDGYMVLVVCDLERPESETPDRNQIANEIGRQRLSTLAYRYLRDLRRAAVVELR